MEIVEDELANVTEARAYQVDDVLVVQVAVTRPTACHVVRLERALTDVEPPSFAARMSIHPAMRCAPVEASFDVAQAFRVGAAREEVVVHHAGEPITVPVQLLDTSAQRSAAPAGPRIVELPQHEPREAVGYSKDWDLQEAMRDAIDQLPKREDVVDWLYRYTVVEVGAEVGGVAGFNRLRVTVRG